MRKKTESSRSSAGAKSVYQILKQDHQNVKRLFKEILNNHGKADGAFSEIKKELEAHMAAEEKHFYPALENNASTRDLILEAYEEHNAARDLIKKAESEPEDDLWMAKVKVLSDVIDHHIEEEEGMIFKKAKAALSKEEEKRITELVKNEKSQPSPETPQESPDVPQEEGGIGQGEEEEEGIS